MAKKTIPAVCLLLGTLLLTECAPFGATTPVVNLGQHELIGLLVFTCDKEGVLGDIATQQFLERLAGYQPGIRVLELGVTKDVLHGVGHQSMTPAAVMAVGNEYGLESLIVGTLTVEDVKTRVNLATILTSLNVRAEVEATLEVRMFEAGSGATIWTKAVNRQRSVTEVHASADGGIWFDARDPAEAYGELVDALVRGVTRDFRTGRRR